jgi:hypothetical protein
MRLKRAAAEGTSCMRLKRAATGVMYFAVENDAKKIATQRKIGAACEWRASSRRIVDNELVNAPFRSRTANE